MIQCIEKNKMVKRIICDVKINKSSGQKYIYLPKDSFIENEQVEIIKFGVEEKKNE
jgi:hypothetical protein